MHVQELVKRLQSEPDCYVYELSRPKGKLYILWCESGTSTRQFNLNTGSAAVSVTPALKERSDKTTVTTKVATAGQVSLPLSPVPLYVEPVN